MQAHGSASMLEHSGKFYMHSGTFCTHSGCILEHSARVLHAFWNILDVVERDAASSDDAELK